MKKSDTGTEKKRHDGEKHQPLYIRIAQWGLALGRPFTAQEMAAEFGLSAVKAHGMMHYICGQGEARVSVRRTWRQGLTPMKREVMDTLEILAVAESAPAKRRARKRPPESSSSGLQGVWQMLARERRKGGMS